VLATTRRLLLGLIRLSAVEEASYELSCKATKPSARTTAAMAPTTPTAMRTLPSTLPSKKGTCKTSKARLSLRLMLPTCYGVDREILIPKPVISNGSRPRYLVRLTPSKLRSVSTTFPFASLTTVLPSGCTSLVPAGLEKGSAYC